MFESGYNKLYWGMIFIIFNLNIGPINILPNFIGYILILSGIGILSGQHKFFEKGRIPAIILIILTLKDIVNLGNLNLLKSGFELKNIFFTAIGVVELLLSIYLIFILCKGIYLISEDRGLDELSSSAKTRFNFYFVVSVVLLIFTPFSINLPRHLGAILFLGALINIIALLFIAGLFRKSKYLLGEDTNNVDTYDI